MFRDSQGRFRKEVTLPSIGPLAASGRLHSFVVISDPVTVTSYVLEPEQKVARKSSIRGGPRGDTPYRKWKEKTDANVKTESLGTQVINGVSAEGTRNTLTIAAGEIGNDKPIMIVSERWFSPELQMVVKSARTDPRWGNTTYSVTNIQRTEPAASLFAVPADYTVQSGRAHGEGRRHRVPDGPPPGPGAPPPGDS
jgi:hypothetical protein